MKKLTDKEIHALEHKAFQRGLKRMKDLIENLPDDEEITESIRASLEDYPNYHKIINFEELTKAEKIESFMTNLMYTFKIGEILNTSIVHKNKIVDFANKLFSLPNTTILMLEIAKLKNIVVVTKAVQFNFIEEFSNEVISNPNKLFGIYTIEFRTEINKWVVKYATIDL